MKSQIAICCHMEKVRNCVELLICQHLLKLLPWLNESTFFHIYCINELDNQHPISMVVYTGGAC
jgi:hypothetical protein